MADYIASSWMSAGAFFVVDSTAKSSWNPGVVVHTAVLALGRVKPTVSLRLVLATQKIA